MSVKKPRQAGPGRVSRFLRGAGRRGRRDGALRQMCQERRRDSEEDCFRQMARDPK